MNKWSGAAVATRQAVGRAQTFTITNAGLAFDLYADVPLIQNDHKIYFRISITPSFSVSSNIFGLRTGRSTAAHYFEITANKKQTVAIINYVRNGEQDINNTYFVIQNARNFVVGDEFTIEDLQIIDLTKMFGSDAAIVSALGLSSVDEITTDKAVKAFERLFPAPYYAYGKDICFVSRYLLIYNIKNHLNYTENI